YSAIELLLYQNKIEEALTRMEQLKKGIANAPANTDPTAPKILTSLSNKAILDDVYWLEANLKMKQGKFQESIGLLQRILDEYGEDILADDAYFLQGDIYERQLKDKDKAMEIYREFLNKYPGSVHVAEARKRFRQLRGDFEKPNQ
ncbi:MAG TPA: tetratricopeptide repeat protein, partial [Cyclobacteriaceae bacterium]|nr:tetratricopeptide repeat protein [Cyclobacteriaceae bacterium]